MAGNHRRLLGQNDLDTAALEPGAVELTVVLRDASRVHHHAVAERILATGMQRQTGLPAALGDEGEIRQAAEVVDVAVADDQSIRVRRLYSQHGVVIGEGRHPVAEVQQDLPPLRSSD